MRPQPMDEFVDFAKLFCRSVRIVGVVAVFVEKLVVPVVHRQPEQGFAELVANT